MLVSARVTADPRARRLGQRSRTNCAEIGRDLVGEHLLEAEAEEMGCVAAVRTGRHVAAEAGSAARSSVACCATVRETGADGEFEVDVAEAVSRGRALSFEARELPLEELPSAANGAERVVGDHVLRRVRIRSPTPIANLRWIRPVHQRQRDPLICRVRRLVLVDELAEDLRRGRQPQHGR